MQEDKLHKEKRENKKENDITAGGERLQKILAARGVASRRAVEQMIQDGRVTLNGQVAKLGDRAIPDTDEILLDGKPLPGTAKLRHILLYKPAGYITSASDPRGRRTVLDLLPKGERLYPVGRLDYATSGLLLVTNDGELTNALLHPRGEVDKVYHCAVRGAVAEEKLQRLRDGILLSDGMTAPAKAKLLRKDGGNSVIRLVIHEGRNRQVRRMMAACSLEVVWLQRAEFAGLTLQGLRPGQWRDLTVAEVAKLRRLGGI